MRKLLFFFGCLFVCSSAFCQAPNFIYAEIVGTGKMLSNKVTVDIDFGQATKAFEDTRLRGEDGKPMKFNSMVDAMNWMGSDGWEFAQAYVITTGQQNVYHWLLKKDVSTLSDEEKSALGSEFKTKKNN